ncbi:MAG: FAD-dependent oxidoreductase [Candidatus Palauibacterales bacterium]|nr:FAD-dependent oxidoreductase [Candidatus Palauibacterales bacterium]
MDYDYLIVGGGLAAASAVDGIREVDEDGSIAVLSDEEDAPYHRPPLSKEFLQAPDGAPRSLLHVKPEGWFEEEADAELHLGRRATRLSPDAMKVETASGGDVTARRILLVTGGRPRDLDVPGTDLEGVATLRTAGDSERIRSRAREADRTVLVGAGFIGMELAAAFTDFDARPTVVEVQDRVWGRMLPGRLADWMQSYFEERGVEFRLGESVDAFAGGDAVEEAELSGGGRLDCGLAVVGVGIRPNHELAADAGLAVDDGIVVDEHAETDAEGIYAAGDVARYPDPVFGDRARVEHWDHAKAHGRLAGRNMAGAGESYDHLSYFFTDVFDLSLNVYGRPTTADRTVLRGDLEDAADEGCVALGERDGRVVSAILINDQEPMDACRRLVRARATFDERLGDPGAGLEDLADELGA